MTHDDILAYIVTETLRSALRERGARKRHHQRQPADEASEDVPERHVLPEGRRMLLDVPSPRP